MFDSPPSRFFLDPWASEYGSALEADIEDDDQTEDAPPDYVEPSDWREGIAPRHVPQPKRVIFVDGVQRIDAFGRVLAGERLVEAALASVAVGAAICEPDGADFASEPLLERVLALTEGADAPRMSFAAGNAELDYLPKNHSEHGAKGIRLAIKERRAEMEREFAEARVGRDCLTVLDGRLSFERGAAIPLVGYVKTIYKFYIDAERLKLLPRLEAGQRTPVFRIRHGETSRYSWFLKLPNVQPIHHPFAGIVRLETPEIGDQTAIDLANLTAYYLPGFASQPEHDPRAPQNLVPVGALEQQLRHELGDALFVRRAIEDFLYEEPE